MLPCNIRPQGVIQTLHRYGKLSSILGWENRTFISLIQLPGVGTSVGSSHSMKKFATIIMEGLSKEANVSRDVVTLICQGEERVSIVSIRKDGSGFLGD